MKIISVVRDFEMYNRLVKDNPFNKGAEFICFNNNEENLSISKRYNSFLNGYDYDNEDWFVFCHEDWEVKENLQSRLNEIDKDCLYGPIGVNWRYSVKEAIGCITHCNKDGANEEKAGLENYNLKQASTFDCQCLIVHSSLVKKYGLRFDENLTFDLYVEDFCINAYEKHKIISKILQLDCQHWSKGKVTERWYKQFDYLKTKYKNCKGLYTGTCFKSEPIWGKCIKNRVVYLSRIIYAGIIRFFYQRKITKSGKLSVKICKIPVFRRKQ